MSVPVYWLNFNPDAISRGYWAQTLLEDLLARRFWLPAQAVTYYDVDDPFVVQQADKGRQLQVGGDLRGRSGGVVVLPGDHNAAHINQVNAFLHEMPWCLLIITGDEQGLFPWELLTHHNRAVWASGAHPSTGPSVHRMWGFGYGPAAKYLDTYTEPFRDLTVSFVGQATHTRRAQCIEALYRHVPGEDRLVRTTNSFGNQDGDGLDEDDYADVMSRSIAVACPSGPASPDSFRLYEALEAGCVPWADETVGSTEVGEFWPGIFGGGVPFPVVKDWDKQVPMVLARARGNYPAENTRVSAWWQEWKRELAYDLDRTVRELSGVPAGPELRAMSDLLTVMVSSSPTVHHPSTSALDETIDSIRQRLGDCEILVGFDGVRPEAEHLRAAYEEYLEAAVWKCAHVWHNVLPIVLTDHAHQAGTARQVMARVHTPTVLFVEHDTPLMGDIPFEDIVRVVETNELSVIRLHHSTDIGDYHAHMMLDTQDKPRTYHGLPIVRTVQWSQRPHVANASFYAWMLRTFFGEESRCHIETVMHGVCSVAWHEFGLAGWDRFRLGLYAPPGDMQRSGHLDTGKGQATYTETIAYDGPRPDCAPMPGVG